MEKATKIVPNEEEFLSRLLQASRVAGISADKNTIINLHVALKSKPLVLLAGPKGVGKIKLIETYARLALKDTSTQLQMMSGHAHWATGSSNAALFSHAQTRLNSSKLLALIEEAFQPGNSRNLYIACMARVSPAELHGYFKSISFQLRNKRIMRLPSIHLNQPIPAPGNLALVGTLDKKNFVRPDEVLLSQTTVINWVAAPFQADEELLNFEPFVNTEMGFYSNAIRDTDKAKSKLRKNPKLFGLAKQRIILINNALIGNDIRLGQTVFNEIFIYLSNAWTDTNVGLFDSNPASNLNVALDLAIAQIILARVWKEAKESSGFRKDIRSTLSKHYINSQAILSF